jgi:CrcB protein
VIVVAVGLAGGIGAALRLVTDAAVVRTLPARVPVATALINVLGSFLLGLVLGLAAGDPAWDGARLVLGTGLLGGYTTFSTASVEAATIARGGGRRPVLLATAHAAGMLALALAAAAAGWALGRG